MNWITDNLAIGNYLDARDLELLSKEGVASILSLDGGLAGINPAVLGVKKIQVIKLQDGAGNRPETFISAIRVLQKLLVENPPVLVQCHAGRSRSVILVAGYFMATAGITADEAIAKVAAKREIEITPGIERLLSFVT